VIFKKTNEEFKTREEGNKVEKLSRVKDEIMKDGLMIN